MARLVERYRLICANTVVQSNSTYNIGTGEPKIVKMLGDSDQVRNLGPIVSHDTKKRGSENKCCLNICSNVSAPYLFTAILLALTRKDKIDTAVVIQNNPNNLLF